MASKRRLVVGSSGKVVDPAKIGNGNNLRLLPNDDDIKNPPTRLVPVDATVKIIDGPCEQRNGWVWWVVRVDSDDLNLCDNKIGWTVGWMNEWDGDYNLQPI